ncbi:hypothetical protein BpHYR1_017329 [Brachionus plicatilis]|uniref:Uncharacterized protein n=1 Tax=Brachionus plicatilis TaxID=10195 RepID=A0A3M7Q0W7_BRAPC|nr:hypothetical protein BpHYR1_017329 [Brachionus plicatilis]
MKVRNNLEAFVSDSADRFGRHFFAVNIPLGLEHWLDDIFGPGAQRQHCLRFFNFLEQTALLERLNDRLSGIEALHCGKLATLCRHITLVIYDCNKC